MKIPACKNSKILIPFTDTADQRILQFDWTRCTIGNIQTEEVASWCLPLMIISIKDLEHHLFPSRDNDDQKTTNQPLKVVSYATFPSGLKKCRKLRH